MSGRRAPSVPPRIDGFEHVGFLGSGGFADVFLYEQQRPRRRVAVKVLLHGSLDGAARQRFDAEADRMAQLSTHPAIVTVYEAGVARDGRPYIAMEYCPRPNLGATYRREPLGVAEALRIGIQVAGAVETAHRAGILHRDIKPANILVTEYNRPALTDFGISAVGGHHDAEGMSVPWSPPESFASPPASGPTSDVWALAATVYSLLAGRSPFEVPGASSSDVDLVSRIGRVPLPPTGREDVPGSLERVLATAMATDPSSRYPSALAFARALQQVQTELQLAVTAVDVVEDTLVPDDEAADDDGGTRVRRVVSISPEGTTTRPPTAAPTGAEGTTRPPTTAPAEGSEDTVVRPTGGAAPAADTVARPADATVARPDTAPAVAVAPAAAVTDLPPTRSRRAAIVAGLVALALVAVVVVAVLQGGGGGTPADDPSETARPADPVGQLVPTPADLTGVVGAAGVVFTWRNPEPQPDDTFLWRTVTAIDEGEYVETTDPTATVPPAEDGATCVEVVVRRHGATSATPARACAGP